MAIFVAGTGTDVGKTLFSALVMARYGRELNLQYFKPVQTGDAIDSEMIANLTGFSDAHFRPEEYRLKLAASPHFAAESEGITIDTAALAENLKTAALKGVVIELAGGLMVPLSRYFTNLDLIRAVGFSAVLVAATGLGTINHTVLSWQALQAAGIPCPGIFFVGPDNMLRIDNVRTIVGMTGADNLGEFLIPEKQLSPTEFQVLARGFDVAGKVKAIWS
jgi:dethiobiotin synthetase